MEENVHNIVIQQSDRGYWEVYADGEFYCTADSYVEAVKETQWISGIREIYTPYYERS